MRGILRTGLIGCVVLGSVTVTDEVRATPGSGVPARTVDAWTMDGPGPREPLVLDVIPAGPGDADQRGRS